MRTVVVADCDGEFSAQAEQALAAVYEVLVVSAREACLALARAESPDLIVVGCLEPRGEAFALCRQLREEPATREIPILVVDVCARDHARKGWTRSEGLQMETEGYVARPLTAAALRAEVEAILARSRFRKESWREALDETERRLKKEAESWRRMVGEMLRKAEAEMLEGSPSGDETHRA
jgi:DNA-binding response OmpR family regulator